jgi:zinc/manganese transport system substrate-binding protein
MNIPTLLLAATLALVGNDVSEIASSSQPGAQVQKDTAPIKVIATVPTYARLAEVIGGDQVDVVLLARPTQDVHSVRATPSLMARVRNSDLCLHTGLDAELWLDGLLRGSANLDLLPGNPNSIAMSDGIALKEIPGIVDRSQGDLHAFGNIHIWADPYNVRIMAGHVRDALIRQRPSEAEPITERHAAFHKQLTQALIKWLTEYQSLKSQPVVVYHRSWIYFLDRFGLIQDGTLEPKPRVAPTASHLAKLEKKMNEQGVHVILREPFQHPEAADHVADATGASVLLLSTHPGYPEGVNGIIEHFDYNLRTIANALTADDG